MLSFCGPCFQINRPPGCVWAVKTIPKLLAVLLIPGISPGPPWERTQQNSCLHFLLQLKDGCFPRGRSFEAETRWSYGPGDRKQIFPSFFKHLKRIIPVARYFREKKIWRTCAISAFSSLAISPPRDRGRERYWDPGAGSRKTNAQPSLSPPLSRSKNDCVGREGFTSALSQSECQGKSRLTFLASGKKKAIAFYVYILLG